MHRLITALVSSACVLLAFAMDWQTTILALFGGIVLSGTLDGAVRDFLASLEPANRAQRRIANASARAVEQRMQAMREVVKGDTGAHAAG